MGRIEGKRYEELKGMLEKRLMEVRTDISARVKDLRSSNKNRSGSRIHSIDDNPGDGIQEDIDFTLIQMRHENVRRLSEALSRLEEGSYGSCSDCGGEIASARLWALPFAIRCKDCEQAHENLKRIKETQEGRKFTLPLF